MKIDFHKLITKKYSFDHSIKSSRKKLSIAYGIDRNFLFGSGISMTSVLVNNPDIAFTFYIVTDYVDDDYINCVARLAEAYSTTIAVLVFNNELFRQLPSTKSWTYAMYYRYFAFEYLSGELNSVLYLDADIICKGSLRDFTDIKFKGEYAAVVNDIDDVRLKSGERLGIPALSKGYFNSGVVFANLIVWKEQNLLEKAFSILLDNKKNLLYFDQDVLNILFVDNVIFLSRDFNCIYGVDQELVNKRKDIYQDYITDNTALIHYVGVTKPWHSWAKYPVSKFFLAAYEKSSWAEKSLLNANTAKLFKRKSRHERIQRKYIRSVFSHIMYIKTKLSSKIV
ncbi:glycosyltransferase family 8 protein [Cedecea colo]|uniref:Lipopolysaccharide 1,2-glucosyltransferase n=1 Tax=Cedecea colo TaxID=2552946 RepID=A0ABX0VS10_9ENTR|nr:glycosyltransferase [Cedecea colo]NIY49738.1 lipopolysaccharide 1,2-glucosyltransferase [Cedecea colo]